MFGINDSFGVTNGKISKLSTNFETLQKARQDLIGEIEAVIQYDNHIQSSTDSIARQTWQNIRNEEMTHIGELLALLDYLDPSQKTFVENGIKEFNERLQ